jgi:hypothetical protein
VLNEQGYKTTQLAFDPPFFFGSPAIATSPQGQSLLVGWREAAPNQESVAKLARFDCFGAL